MKHIHLLCNAFNGNNTGKNLARKKKIKAKFNDWEELLRSKNISLLSYANHILHPK